MIDLIIENLSEITLSTVLGIYVIVSNRFRTLSDKNIINNFESFKTISRALQEKTWDVSSVISNVDNITKSLKTDFNSLKSDISNDLTSIKEIIETFKESDVYNELVEVKEDLKTLKALYKQEREEKQYYQKIIKAIEKKMGGLDV